MKLVKESLDLCCKALSLKKTNHVNNFYRQFLSYLYLSINDNA